MLEPDLIQAVYDATAETYLEKLGDELSHKPFDRDLLARFVGTVSAPGDETRRIADIGCGPGHITNHLAGLGANVLGIDLSQGMIELARTKFEGLEFRQGDMLDLSLDPESLDGVIALYSIIHLDRGDWPVAAAEFHRVLKPGGRLLVSFHIGQGNLHNDDFCGQGLEMDCTLYQPDEIAAVLELIGFDLAELTIRRPYDTEYPSRRGYVVAEKVADALPPPNSASS